MSNTWHLIRKPSSWCENSMKTIQAFPRLTTGQQATGPFDYWGGFPSASFSHPSSPPWSRMQNPMPQGSGFMRELFWHSCSTDQVQKAAIFLWSSQLQSLSHGKRDRDRTDRDRYKSPISSLQVFGAFDFILQSNSNHGLMWETTGFVSLYVNACLCSQPQEWKNGNSPLCLLRWMESTLHLSSGKSRTGQMRGGGRKLAGRYRNITERTILGAWGGVCGGSFHSPTTTYTVPRENSALISLVRPLLSTGPSCSSSHSPWSPLVGGFALPQHLGHTRCTTQIAPHSTGRPRTAEWRDLQLLGKKGGHLGSGTDSGWGTIWHSTGACFSPRAQQRPIPATTEPPQTAPFTLLIESTSLPVLDSDHVGQGPTKRPWGAASLPSPLPDPPPTKYF